MDWENERYVRLYVRDTDDWLALTWQARAMFPLMLRKVDRSGILHTRRGVVGIAAQTGLPLDVCEAGLPDLLRDGSVTKCDAGYLFPNYLAAQEARQSDKQRAKEARARRRDLAIIESQNGTAASQDVTRESQDVTEPSHGVTRRHSSRAVPSHAVPSHAERGARNRAPAPEWVSDALAHWIRAVGHLTPTRIQRALGPLVTAHTWAVVRAALEVYVSPEEGPASKGRDRRVEWFAADFQRWHLLATQPLDDGQGALTDRGKRLLSV